MQWKCAARNTTARLPPHATAREIHACFTRNIHARDIHAQGGRPRDWLPLTAGAERRNGNEKEERNEERANPRPHGLGVAHGCVRGWRAGGRTPPEPPTRQQPDRGRTRERRNPKEERDAPLKKETPQRNTENKNCNYATCGYTMGGLDDERREGYTLVSYVVNSDMRSIGTPYTSLKYFCK